MKLNIAGNVVFKEDVYLAEHCSFEIGGKAGAFVLPRTMEELQSVMELCSAQGRPYYIFGYGSNILFPDSPANDTVYISLKHMIDCQWSKDRGEQTIFLTSGVPLSFLALIGMLCKYEKLLFAYLLPGSVGAGVYINAKCYDDQMSGVIEKIHYIDPEDLMSGIQTLSADQCEFAYKQSIFQRRPWIVVGVDLAVPGINGEIFAMIQAMLTQYQMGKSDITKMQQFYRHFYALAAEASDKYQIELPQQFTKIDRDRNGKQHFSYPSCGSVFKNNYAYGKPMGVLIDQLNLKGKSFGGAMISPHHGNFIVNYQHAKASDVLYLIQYTQDAVNQAYGFVPEPEVIILSGD